MATDTHTHTHARRLLAHRDLFRKQFIWQIVPFGQCVTVKCVFVLMFENISERILNKKGFAARWRQ